MYAPAYSLCIMVKVINNICYISKCLSTDCKSRSGSAIGHRWSVLSAGSGTGGGATSGSGTHNNNNTNLSNNNNNTLMVKSLNLPKDDCTLIYRRKSSGSSPHAHAAHAAIQQQVAQQNLYLHQQHVADSSTYQLSDDFECHADGSLLLRWVKAKSYKLRELSWEVMSYILTFTAKLHWLYNSLNYYYYFSVYLRDIWTLALCCNHITWLFITGYPHHKPRHHYAAIRIAWVERNMSPQARRRPHLWWGNLIICTILPLPTAAGRARIRRSRGWQNCCINQDPLCCHSRRCCSVKISS